MERETTRPFRIDLGKRYERYGRGAWVREYPFHRPVASRYGWDVLLMCVGTGIAGFGLGLAFAMLKFVL